MLKTVHVDAGCVGMQSVSFQELTCADCSFFIIYFEIQKSEVPSRLGSMMLHRKGNLEKVIEISIFFSYLPVIMAK